MRFEINTLQMELVSLVITYLRLKNL